MICFIQATNLKRQISRKECGRLVDTPARAPDRWNTDKVNERQHSAAMCEYDIAGLINTDAITDIEGISFEFSSGCKIDKRSFAQHVIAVDPAGIHSRC